MANRQVKVIKGSIQHNKKLYLPGDVFIASEEHVARLFEKGLVETFNGTVHGGPGRPKSTNKEREEDSADGTVPAPTPYEALGKQELLKLLKERGINASPRADRAWYIKLLAESDARGGGLESVETTDRVEGSPVIDPVE